MPDVSIPSRLQSPTGTKMIWVFRCWQPGLGPTRIEIGENQTLSDALRLRGEPVPLLYHAVTSDGRRLPGDILTGRQVREDTTVYTALMQALDGG